MPLITSITPSPSIELAHHRIHEGNHYATHHIHDITMPGFVDFLITTPPIAQAETHLIFEFFVEFKSRLDMYEDVGIIDHGIQLKSENYNRIATNLPLTNTYMSPTLAAGEPFANKKIFEDQEGTLLETAHIGESNRNEDEFVLKGSTNYLFRLTPDPASLATSMYTTLEFNWYDARPSTIS
jgi:hypothetical protein